MKQLLLLTTVLVLSSCARSSYVYLDQTKPKYASINPSEVVIFQDKEDLPNSYEKVAIITTDYCSTCTKYKWESTREKAAKLGCNGIYEVTKTRTVTSGSVITDTDDDHVAEFVAIRYDR